MARLQWALTCKEVTIDSETNTVTYRDGIEQIVSKEYPVQIPSIITVAIVWRRSDLEIPETFRYRVILEDENRDYVSHTDPEEIDLEGYERFRAHVKNPPMEVENPGTVWFRVQKNEGEGWEDSWGLPVELKPAAEED